MRHLYGLKQMRAFRIPVRQEDNIVLSLHEGDQEILNKNANCLKDISLTGLGFASDKKFEIGQRLELKLEFSDYKNIIDGIVVRSNIHEDQYITGLVFDFEEGETFDSFFQKFINTFNSKRLKSQMINLLEEERKTRPGDVAEIDILADIYEELSQYGSGPLFMESFLLQAKEELKLDAIHLLRRDRTDGLFYPRKNTLGMNNGFSLDNSVMKTCLTDRKTVNALIVSDDLLCNKKFIFDCKNHFVAGMAVFGDNQEVKGIFFGARSRDKGKFTQNEISLMKFISLELKHGMNNNLGRFFKEPVKYLNPKKPREFAMIGQSEKIQDMRKFISKSKLEMEPILIKGKAGSGRKLFAQVVHSEGKTGHLEFLELDASRTSHLETFNRILANSKLGSEFKKYGTFFITSFEVLDFEIQKDLLKFAYSNKDRARFIFTTVENLEEHHSISDVILKLFKNNKVRIPELNQRKEDIPILVNFLVKRECRKKGFLPKEISKEVLDKFKMYDWKGNIRELKTAVSRLVSYNSSNHYIDGFPPENYKIFDYIDNSDYNLFEKVVHCEKVLTEFSFSDEETLVLVKWAVVANELKVHDGNMKKTALALGKPHMELVEFFENGESLLKDLESRKKAA